MARGKSRKNCTSGCPTGGHSSWGECARSKGIQINPSLMDTGRQKAWDTELDAYQSATDQGIHPDTTKMRDIQAALDKSDATGVAYEGS